MTYQELLSTILGIDDRLRRQASLIQLQVCSIELTEDLSVSPSIQWALERWTSTRVAYCATHQQARTVSSDLADILDHVNVLDYPNDHFIPYRVKPTIAGDGLAELARVEALADFTLEPLVFPS